MVKILKNTEDSRKGIRGTKKQKKMEAIRK